MLVKLRKDAGFVTAYKFFYDNGGDKVLGMCYRKYLMMEQGRFLPQFKHLRAFIYGLHLQNRSAAANGLADAWLRTMAGEELYGEILAPLFAEKQAALAQSPSNRALKEALNNKKIYLTPAQMDVLSPDLQTYRCYLLLSNDTDVWTAERLAEVSGLKKIAAEKLLKKFLAAKLLRKAGPGYRCHLSDAMVESPHSSLARAAFERIRDFQREMVASGTQTHRRYGLLRADEHNLAEFYPMMDAGLSSAHFYAIHKKTPKSALFMVEAKTVKLMDF